MNTEQIFIIKAVQESNKDLEREVMRTDNNDLICELETRRKHLELAKMDLTNFYKLKEIIKE